MFNAVLAAPFGRLGLRADAAVLHEIVFLPDSVALQAPDTAVAALAAAQLQRYFDQADMHFDLPLADTGTPHRRRVWQAIAAIPRGQTRTYGALARELGSAPRAVGQACGANPFPLVVPCHRVVAASGLGGFSNQAAEGLHRSIKRWLLRREGVLQ